MMKGSRYRSLFGPVPSRRLGRSLGIDLVPFKTCSLNCVYCQLGPTTRRTTQRRPFVPAAEIIRDLRRWLDDGGRADFITLAGSGEPTLNSEIGEVIRFVKTETDTPVAVLTNGTLFFDETLREDCRDADLIIPSVDAGTPETFARVNQPAPELDFDRVIEGLIALRSEYEGEIWAEVMLVRGYNDGPEELAAIRAALDRIRPDQVQVNTVVRPSGTAPVEALGREELQRATTVLGPNAAIIAPLDREFAGIEGAQATEEGVLSLLRRRPCTLTDISVGLAVHRNEVLKYLAKLLGEGPIRSVDRGGETYYEAVEIGA